MKRIDYTGTLQDSSETKDEARSWRQDFLERISDEISSKKYTIMNHQTKKILSFHCLSAVTAR
jgi:vacuolar-type H+-ATPase subunit H